MKKLAIIGASYLQKPLIDRARERGIETHVFAWKKGDVGETCADYFYPISIVEKEQILLKCKEIGIDGICTIASDLAVITVNYVANELGLIGNTMHATEMSTNKNKMRQCFEFHGDPSPKSIKVQSIEDLDTENITYPIIVKPVDRSGSRGITKLNSFEGLYEAIENAKKCGFEKYALVEEFVTGEEFSVECISWKGNHTFLAMTKKFTTGAPGFIETAHLEPAPIGEDLLEKVKEIVFHALTSLGIYYGASHTELKISNNNEIKLIEIGGRMGGDCIGSSLVRLSTGINFIDAVIDVALGIEPNLHIQNNGVAAVRFIFTEKDKDVYSQILRERPSILVESDIKEITPINISDSSSRFGYFIFAAKEFEEISQYLPECVEE